MKRTKNTIFLLLATIAMALSLSSCSTMGGFRNPNNSSRFEALCLSPIHDDSLNEQYHGLSEQTGCGAVFEAMNVSMTGSEAVFESTNGYEASLSAFVSEQEKDNVSVYISE